MKHVRSGADVLLESGCSPLRGRKVGLITNQTGVASELQSLAKLLAKRSELRLIALFGPEHGIAGSAPDAAPIDSVRDGALGLPVYSLYGKTEKPTSGMLEGIDALVFDIQDVGVRFYTYAQTMSLSMEAAKEKGLLFVVLDRPNPLTGAVVQGNVLDESFSSFLGRYPIALRHGMTIGELASLFNRHFGIGVDLKVATMKGWKREMWYDQTGMIWVPPSPNMPGLDTAIVYPGMCLLEGTNVSEGRGTSLPFEVAGAPWIEGDELADRLQQRNIGGCLVRPTEFVPTSSKHCGERCRGIQVHITDRIRFKPVEFGLTLISEIRDLNSTRFEWAFDKTSELFHIDLLMGTDKVRKELDSGVPLNIIFNRWDEDIQKFKQTRRDFLLYA